MGQASSLPAVTLRGAARKLRDAARKLRDAVRKPREESLRTLFLLTDVVFERRDDATGDHPSKDLTELWVFGIPGSNDGVRFQLVNSSPQRWELTDIIALQDGIEGIDCVVKGSEGRIIGSVHLDCPWPQTESEQEYNRGVAMCDGHGQLSMSWRAVIFKFPGNGLPIVDIARMNNTAAELRKSFERTGSLTSVNKSITILSRVVELAPNGHAQLPALLSNLGNSFLSRFQCTGGLSDIAAAISAHQRAVHLTPDGDTNLPALLNNLGNSLACRFGQTGDLSDIAEAISAQQRAVQHTPDGHPGLPSRLNNLGNRFLSRFERTGDLSDVAEAILTHQRALRLTPDDHAHLPGQLTSLGNSLACRFEHTGDLSDIAKAISAHQRAVQRTPEGHAGLPSHLNNLGSSLARRFEHTGELSDISEAILAHQGALHITPDGHTDLPALFNNLGNSLLGRFKHTGDLSDIGDAILAHQRAVHHTPNGHTNLPTLLSDLGNSFLGRFKHTGSLSDIEEAISAHQRAVHHTPSGHTGLPLRLNNLGNSFLGRFECTGDLSDIAEAISAHKEGVRHTPDGHANLPVWLNNLGSSLLGRFKRTGNLSDIAEAISAHQRAIEQTPDGHADLPCWLNNLGNSLLSRFKSTGDLSDIAQAISAHQRAVRLTPDGHTELRYWVNNLGNPFLSRFKRTGDLSDIAEAIAAHQRAVQLTPDGHAHLPGHLNNVGNSFLARFERTGKLSDIEEAISAHQKAVQKTPDGHTDLPGWLNNLGNSFLGRFECTGDLSDINEAILAHQRAVHHTPDGHPNLPALLSNLGNSLLSRFKRTGDVSDIAEAISAHQRAVNHTPDGHANLPGRLNNLGTSLAHRLERAAAHTHSHIDASSDDWNASISAFKLAATAISGSPREKFKAARNWAHSLSQHQLNSSDLFLAFDTALQLVTLIAGLEQTVQIRHTQLHNVSDIALEAASVACSLGRADKALEWLEQGRCLVWNQINQLRTPLNNLRRHDKELEARVANVATQLEHAGSSRIHSNTISTLPEKISLEAEAGAHLHLARDWEKLLGEVRAITGFETFLLPPPCSALLQHLPESGAIVVMLSCLSLDWVNHSTFLFPSSLEKRHKPITDKEVPESGGGEIPSSEDSGAVTDRVAEQVKRGEYPVSKILRGLWTNLVKPILDGLAFSKIEGGSGDDARPRVWWCPTGPLSFLPIHAAGIYGGTKSESILDYVVSSYTPNVTALTRRIKDRLLIDDSVAGLFLTSQPDAIVGSPIPGTTREVQQIYQAAFERGTRVLKLEGSEVTPQECLEHLESFSSVHLACHGSQHPDNPLLSKFSFHEGTLELSAIMRKDLKHADLAFLSACQTSTGDEKLSEEAVHLAAGMLAAGYYRVVGTMWSIGDSTAQRVAVEFYDYLFKRGKEGGGDRFDGSLSARALHHAVQELRKTTGDSDASLLAWVPFVHFGN